MTETTPIYNQLMIMRKWTPADLHDHSQCMLRIVNTHRSRILDREAIAEFVTTRPAKR